MSRGVNKVILIGNAGNDPDCRVLPNGSAVTSFSVATSESWKDKQTGQQQERTEWHKVVTFNRLAEIMRDYLRKGSKVYVEGSLRTRKWQKDGLDMYTTEIIADQIQLLDSRSQDGGSDRPAAPARPAPQAQAQSTEGQFDAFDDDIPF